MYKVLIVDDERELAEILGEYLKLEGFDTYIAYDGETGVELFGQVIPELVILDIMLPKKNGIEVCKDIRKTSDAVVMMLSAKNGEMDKVICLGAGADDYITKPFSPVELVARVKAHARRYSGNAGTAVNAGTTVNTDGVIRTGRLVLNQTAYEARLDGRILELTTKEFELLLFFASHISQVFSKEQIYENVWGLNEYGDIGTVAVYIRKLRSKFDLYRCDYIKTIWGVGYKFVSD